jgi:signal transduction histidine kinase
MRFRLPALDSLRRKIVFGYGAVAFLVIALSTFSLVEMRVIETQIAAGERIGEFLGIALEIRRFEKNYFLYRQETDLDENRAYVAQARRLVEENLRLFESFESTEGIRRLLHSFDAYGGLMSVHAENPDHPGQEALIRQAGKEIVTVAERWARTERNRLQDQLDRHRKWLLGAIVAVAALVVVIGHFLAWRVARPLKQLEQNMAAVGTGQLAQLELKAEDREIASLTQAFNHVLRQLELRQGQLVRSEKLAALGTLLSGVAHELNNPLSNISTSCEILAEELAAEKVGPGRTALDEESAAFRQELLAQIDGETWRARRIVRSLLDYARDRAFKREPVPLAALVEESLRLIKGRIPAQVAIAADIPAALIVAADRQRLQQALFNLVGNAIDALEGAGEVRIAARRTEAPYPADALVFGKSPQGAAIEIEIGDDGHGIAPEILPRIFDPFFTTKEVGHGSGLGLFIVYEIVEEHGGCIAVESVPGQGTTFLVRLPVEENQHG